MTGTSPSTGDYTEARYWRLLPQAPRAALPGPGQDGRIYSLHALGLSLLVLPGVCDRGLRGRLLLHGRPRGAAGPRAAAPAARRGGRSRSGRDRGLRGRAEPAPAELRGPPLHGSPGRPGGRDRASPRPKPRRRSPRGAAFGPRARARLPALAQRALRRALPGARAVRPRAAAGVETGGVAVARARSHRPWPSGPITRSSTASSIRDGSTAAGRSSRSATLREGLPGLLLDQEFGLLVYAPVFALAAAGVAALWRRDRRLTVTGLALVAVVVGTAGTWHMWRGGFNPPARFLVPIVPVLALGLAAALTRGLTAPAALLAGWGLWLGAVGVAEPRLLHRDRDGTAPVFRAVSGAEEWTRLLPGFVLEDAQRSRLAVVWGLALGGRDRVARPRLGPRPGRRLPGTAGGRGNRVPILDRANRRARRRRAWWAARRSWSPACDPSRPRRGRWGPEASRLGPGLRAPSVSVGGPPGRTAAPARGCVRDRGPGGGPGRRSGLARAGPRGRPGTAASGLRARSARAISPGSRLPPLHAT